MNYKIGRDNFALTIFIPADCRNNCPFCTSKIDYSVNIPNIDKVCESIARIGKFDIQFHDIVITGGEPFAKFHILEKILKGVAENLIFQNLYVNTTLPGSAMYEKEVLDYNEMSQIINKCDIISGLNVSRHLEFDFWNGVFDENAMKKINKPIRINCILPDREIDGEYETDVLDKYNLYKDIAANIAFRCDYRHITPDSLHSLNNDKFKLLDKLFGYQYSNQCHVCHTDIFGDNKNVMLHRGLEHSSIDFSNFTEINDLIVKQDGEVLFDWFRNKKATDEVLKELGGK